MPRVRSNQLLFKEYMLVNYNKKFLYKRKIIKKNLAHQYKKIFFSEGIL